MAKITLIGAGSVVFAKNLIGDILQFPGIADSEICLMDIDPSRLKVAEIMARKMVAKLGTKAKIKATTNRRTAVRNANYVICTIQVGGYKPGTLIDFEIPKRYGLQQTIADTLGIGGIFRSLRTIPEINKIAKDIADIAADDCLLLNYTNPMAMNCMAVDREVGIPHVGLCHSVQSTSKQLADYAGLPYEEVSYLVAGINHMAFFLRFDYKGQDAYPLLFKALDNPQTYTQNKVRFEMMRRLGYFVTESSEHQAEYNPYFIHHGQETIDQFDIPIDEYLRRCEAIISTWKETERDLLGNNDDIEIQPRTHEYGSFIINARETNTPTVVYGNVPNNNLITNLPDRCCVEVPCLVDANGIQPTHIGPLPTQLAAICRTNVNVQELTVEAALSNRREAIYHAAMMDPHTSASLPLDKIWALCDELIEAHQKEGLLGQYSSVLKNTGRGFSGIGDRIIAKLTPHGRFENSAGSLNTIALTVENPTSISHDLRFDLSGPTDILGTSWNKRIKLTVPAGKTKTKSISFKLKSDAHQGIRIDLSTQKENVLCQGTDLQSRNILQSKAKEKIPFDLKLHGNPAAKGSIQFLKTGLRLEAHISDSLITEPNRCLSEWSGSRLELHLAAQNEARIHSIYLAPKPSAATPQVTDYNLNKIKTRKLSQCITKMGYQIEATLPYDSIGLTPNCDSILIDIVCGLGALGDSHSGGQTSLSGEFTTDRDSSKFWEAKR